MCSGEIVIFFAVFIVTVVVNESKGGYPDTVVQCSCLPFYCGLHLIEEENAYLNDLSPGSRGWAGSLCPI